MELFKILGTVAIDGSGAKSELQDVTNVAEQSQSKISSAFEKIGSAALAVGATVGAGLAAASTAVAGLAKNALGSYAEYEQLVGGVETLFKESASKVQAYANEAYKTAGLSANAYMDTVTSFSASLLQSLASSASDAGEMSVEATVESLEKQYSAVEESNEKKLELLEEAHESELEAFEELTEQKIALIDKQYKENLKLIDEEKYNKIKAIDEQIDALNAQTQAEKDAIKRREQEQKIASLKEKILVAETATAKEKAQQDLDDLLADIAQEAREKERKAQIDALKGQKDLIKEEADEKKEILKEQYEAEKQAVKDASADRLKEIKKAQKAEADALKKANKAKLAEMGDYVDEQLALLEQSSSGMVYTAETYEQAAEKANQAIIDMSDNANKMGTNMASIQNAYQGFAKQNYTMLDNLKLGYGGTKEEMQRLLTDATAISGIHYDISSYADIIDAIHIIQTEMGITGTTAAEASTTIQGSFASMKAAWSNLVTGLGNEEADLSGLIEQFVASADTVMTNVLPRIEIILGGITDLIAQILPKISEKLPELLNTMLPSLIEAAVQLVNGLVQALPTILQILIEQIPYIVTEIGKGLTEAFPVLLETVETLFGQIFDYISLELLNTEVSFEDAVTKMSEIFNTAWTTMQQVWTEYGQPIWEKISGAFKTFSDEVLKPLIEVYLNNLKTKFDALVEMWETVVVPIIEIVIDAFERIVSSIYKNVEPAIKKIMDKFNELASLVRKAVKEYILPVIQSFVEMIKELYEENKEKLELIGELFAAIFEWISDVVERFVSWFKGTFLPFLEEIRNFVQENMDKIKGIFQNVLNIITGIIQAFIALFKGDWEGLWESVKSILENAFLIIRGIFELIGAAISEKVLAIKDAVTEKFEEIKSNMSEKIQSAKDSVLEVFENLKSGVEEKITAVKEKVADIFDEIKSTISRKIRAAKDVVEDVVESIKGFFDFEMSMPDIKLPHFTIEPEGWKLKDLLDGVIPELDIEWYSKGGVMENPTAFGMNGNRLMVGGEAGPEAIAPIDVLQGYIAQAVATQNTALVAVLQQILDAILAMDANMGGNLRDALEGTAFEMNHREFARLVKAVN